MKKAKKKKKALYMKAVPFARLHAQRPRLLGDPDEASVRPGFGLAQGSDLLTYSEPTKWKVDSNF